MSHAEKADKLLIKPPAGAKTGAAAHTRTDHSEGTHTAASHPMSHTRHDDNQARNGPRRTDPPSLTVTRDPRRAVQISDACPSLATPKLRSGLEVEAGTEPASTGGVAHPWIPCATVTWVWCLCSAFSSSWVPAGLRSKTMFFTVPVKAYGALSS
jgi:hypothetical protein